MDLVAGKNRKDFMIVGVNMSNPQTGNYGNGKLAPSVCSLVLSTDVDCTRWAHAFRVQKRGEELIADLGSMFSDAVTKRSEIMVRLVRLFSTFLHSEFFSICYPKWPNSCRQWRPFYSEN